MRFLIRVLLLFFIISAVLSILRGAFASSPQRPRRTPEEPQPRPASTSARLVKDPVCETYIPRRKAISRGSGTDTRYFCSAACADKYLARS